MIDFEDNVVDYLSRNLEKEFPKINVTSEFSINDESTFPTVLVYEMDNYTTFTYKCLISLMVMQI